MYFSQSDVVFVQHMIFAFEALLGQGRAGQGRAGKAQRIIMPTNPFFSYVVFLSETGFYCVECIIQRWKNCRHDHYILPYGRDGNNAAFVIMLWTGQAGSQLLDFNIVFHLLFLFDQVAVVLARHWAEFSWSKEWNTSGARGRPSMIFSKWRIHTVSELKPTSNDL